MESPRHFNGFAIGLSMMMMAGSAYHQMACSQMASLSQFLLPRAEALAAQTVQVKRFGEYIILADGRKMWVEAEILDPKLPTKIIFNGLTNSASNSFGALSRELLNDGVNVVRFDFHGQAKSLMANLPVDPDLDYRKQAQDAVELLPLIKEQLGLEGRIDAIGQSYGGGMILTILGLYPEFAKSFFDSVTVFAPYTEPLRASDEEIMKELRLTRLMFPFWSISDEELYKKIFHRKVMSTYWIFEPEVLGLTPSSSVLYLEGVFSMANGIRPLNAIDLIANMPEMPIHVVMAVSDQYIPSDVIPKFWEALPENKRGYFIKVYETEHKIFQFAPDFTAQLAKLTAEGSAFAMGSELEAHNFTKNIYLGSSSHSKGLRLRDLTRGSACERSFR